MSHLRAARALALCLATAAGLLPLRAQASGVDPTKISLPSGPASVEGLGRSFVPSVASGTATYGVNIAVPPAAGGFSPQLSLDYDSGGGVSELGRGWKLTGLVSIRRRVEGGLPRFDGSDVFELTGLGVPSDLVSMADGYYRTQLEGGAFVRVQRSSDGSQWEARSKAGVTYRFGGDGFVEEEDGRIASYLLREQLDLHGHSIGYRWDTSEGHALLERVLWNDFSATSRQELRFEYEERPDHYELFSSGIRQTITRRLRSVEVLLGTKLVRRYILTYGGGHHSRVESVELVGSDEQTRLPTLIFEYTDEVLAADAQLVEMKAAPGRSPGQTDVDLADLNGDGLPDLLVGQAGQYTSYLNQDGVSWNASEAWPTSPSISLSDLGSQLADLDGDGAADLVAKSGTASFRYFPGKALTAFGAAVTIANVPSFSFEDPEVRLADMDGDRRIDAVVTTPTGIAIGYNLGGTEFTNAALVGRPDATQQLSFSDGQTQLCEINGDRVQDLCQLRSGALVYWLGRGRGRFQPAQNAENVPDFATDEPFRLVDVNGDGWADLLRIGVQTVELALALGAGTFDTPLAVTGVPEKGPNVVSELADMNGSGTTDIVWIDVTSGAAGSWRYLELFPEGRAGLLRRIDNGLGKVTRINYEPAALHAARAREAGRPWTTRMNVAMPVVSKMEVDASNGDVAMATSYDYRDGTWDALDRTFAGFAGGIELALGDEHTPTLVTESTFDTGIELRVLRGAVLLSEKRDEQGLVFARTHTSYTPLDIGMSEDGRALEYAYKSSELSEQVEGLAAEAVRSTLTEWLSDTWGNIIEEQRWGEISGTDYLVGDDEALVVRTYATNEADWIFGQLASEELLNAAGERISLKHNYYDGKAFEGLALGEVTRGELMRISSWIEGAELVNEERYEYDEHGNQITILNLRDGRQEYEYDPETHTALSAERRYVRDGVALEWLTEYDPRFGTLSSLTVPSGAEYSFGYDALGRLEYIVKPGDTAELPTTRHTYELASPLSRVTTEQRVTSGNEETLTTVALVDGLGRTRGTFTKDAEGQWVLSDYISFDARGQTAFTAYPTFEMEVALPREPSEEGTFSYRDALGRAVSVQHVDGTFTLTSYGPLRRTVADENDTAADSLHYDTPTLYESDGLGRVRAIVEREGSAEHRTSFGYDAAGNLLRVEDAAGSVRRYGYDGRSRRTSVDDPNAGTWSFSFSTANDLEQRIDPTGRRVRYGYDALGRITDEWHQQSPDEEERRVVQYHYDEASPEHPELDQYLAGNLAWVEDEGGIVFFDYDARGREVTRLRRFAAGSEYALGVSFDAADRRVERRFPDGSFLTQSYDQRGLLERLGPVVTEASYTAEGDLASAQLGNGVVETHSYDARRRLNRLAAQAPDGAIVRDIRYALDAASRITGVTDMRPDVAPDESLTASYTFDDRYRLREVVDPVGTTSFDYDDVGKITTVTSDHSAPHLNVENSYGESGAGPDQLTHHGDEAFEYDAAGRVVADGSRLLDWDAKGRVSRIEREGVVEEYSYAFDDTRLVKRTSSSAAVEEVRYLAKDVEERDGHLVRYALLGEERIARLDALDSDTARSGVIPTPAPPRNDRTHPLWLWLLALGSALAALLAFPGGRLAPGRLVPRLRVTLALSATAALLASACGSESGKPGGEREGEITELPAQAVFYSANGQRTPLALTNAKAEAISSTSFFPYGAIKSNQGATDPHQFVGNELDSGSGLGDFGARPYRADVGIFLAADPLPLFTPEEALSDPARFFAYAYAGGDPINRADPTGKTFGEYLSGLWDGAKAEGKAVVKATVDQAKGQVSALAEGRVGDFLTMQAQAVVGVLTAPVELVKNVANFGDDFAAAVFAKNDYEAGRLAFKPVSTAMELTAAVMGPRAGVKSPAKSATICPCFSAETLVHTCDGLRNIAEVQVGDLVWSRDPETGAEACQPVLQVFITPDKRLVEVQLQASAGQTETVHATPGHPFWVEGQGWTDAGDLSLGCALATATGDGAVVTGGLSSSRSETVYNLEVANFHTYFVGENGAWVHNVCSCGGGVASSAAQASKLRQWLKKLEAAAGKEAASDAQLGELSGGTGKVMAGRGAKKAIRDEPRLLAEHGGRPGDWEKVTSSSFEASDGVKIETHAYRNAETGVVVEPKVKMSE